MGAEPLHFLAVAGPTASGKSELAMALARRLDGELISADSRQIYRGMDVGTAKPSREDRAQVPHHGLDLCSPSERYSAGQFGRDARRWIQEIRSRGRVPIVVGGTGFFLGALLTPIFREPPMDGERRRILKGILTKWDPAWLAAAVERLDPVRAEVALAGGRARMMRTLEVALLTGRPLSWWHAHAPPEAAPVPGLVVLIRWKRAELNHRIRSRAQAMWRSGLFPEVKTLLQAGFGPGDPGFSGQGYREAAQVLNGEMTPEDGLERTIVRTRQYARRQETWFRHQLPPGSLELDGELPLSQRVIRVAREWEARGGWVGPGARTAAPRGDAK
ncbi:MAG: tRNA (adenosine(37)-N6)-dimethylallyltransferase MiaA [Gemmatimonadota bacterium]